MTQEPLFYEDIYEAARTVVMALGGSKRAGGVLWPEKPIDQASVQMSNCLNRSRPEKLDPEQLLLLAKKGREAGCHALMTFMCADTGYAPPVPVTPEDQRDEAMRQFVSAVKTVQTLTGQLEKLGVKV